MKDVKVGKTKNNPPRTVLPGHTVAERISKDDNESASIVVSTMDGKHPKMKNVSSIGMYCIKKGTATFFVNNTSFEVEENDVITIPANTEYSFEGSFEAFMICIPPFRPEDCIIMDDKTM